MKNSKVKLLVSCQIKMMEHFPGRRMGKQRLNEGALSPLELVLTWPLLV